jgi:hypothetical protein
MAADAEQLRPLKKAGSSSIKAGRKKGAAGFWRGQNWGHAEESLSIKHNKNNVLHELFYSDQQIDIL